jgi:hypothetical protein
MLCRFGSSVGHFCVRICTFVLVKQVIWVPSCVSRGMGSCACSGSAPYVSMRQHTSACVSIRQHASACVSIRQHTSAYVSIRQHTSCVSRGMRSCACSDSAAYVSIRQHASAYVSIRHACRAVWALVRALTLHQQRLRCQYLHFRTSKASKTEHLETLDREHKHRELLLHFCTSGKASTFVPVKQVN